MRSTFVSIAFGLIALVAASTGVIAQPRVPAASQASVPNEASPRAFLVLKDTTRAEAWSFFEPRPGGGDPTYTLLGNRATVGVGVNSRHFDVYGAFQYSQLVGLPRRAVGPGPLGPGALYYDAARATGAYQLYLKAMSLRAKTRGLSIEAGRMGFSSGGEADSGAPVLETLKRERLHARLIGDVDWSVFDRGFDGARLDLDRPRWHANAALLFPTQGGFEESANPTMSGVRVTTASLTLWGAPAPMSSLRESEVQVFANHYRDRRAVRTRPDNNGLPASAADISIGTVGASLVNRAPLGSGRADTVLWIAGQFGDWYGDPHRAVSVLAEGGYQWTSVWRPWLRGGALFASGDGNPADFRHETFFPLVPTTRSRLLAATFAQMNRRDVFAEIQLQPRPMLVVRSELRRMALAKPADRWYLGTGATAIDGTFFGYAGRVAGFETSLGTSIEFGVDAALTRRWSVRSSVGIVNGGKVISGLFAGHRLTVFALENVVTY